MEGLLIELIRTNRRPTSTMGKLMLNGKFFCWTLEDPDRDINQDGDLKDEGEKKIYGDTCIPKGNYDVAIDMSTRFKREMLHVLNVEGFEGIRLHGGNKTADSHGCPLVAYFRDEAKETIWKSAEADLLAECRKYSVIKIKVS